MNNISSLGDEFKYCLFMLVQHFIQSRHRGLNQRSVSLGRTPHAIVPDTVGACDDYQRILVTCELR